MPLIVPAVLAKSQQEFTEKITDPQMRSLASVWQIDVLDGSMFDATSWAEVDDVAEMNDLPELELHLMIEDPLPIVRAWVKHVSSVKRAIVHAEISQPLDEVIEAINALGIESGIALNPETPLEPLRNIIAKADVLLVMGVHPGASGQPFLGNEVVLKIAEARNLFPGKYIAVDGGVNTNSARELFEAGADQLCTASALWEATDRKAAFEALIASA